VDPLWLWDYALQMYLVIECQIANLCTTRLYLIIVGGFDCMSHKTNLLHDKIYDFLEMNKMWNIR